MPALWAISVLVVLLLGAFVGKLRDPVIRDFFVLVVAFWGLANMYAAWRDGRGRTQAVILVAVVGYVVWACISASLAG
jgi:hypothetical protein